MKAGGNISNVQFVSPTNARDAGSMLVATSYNAAAQTGLYVQGGGDVSIQAGGNIGDVYTYVQNGATSLNAGGSVGCSASCNSSNPVTAPMDIESSTGEVSIVAGGAIDIAGPTLAPNLTANTFTGAKFAAPGFSLIQNADFLIDLPPPVSKDTTWASEGTVLTGLLTSIPTGH